MYRQRLERKLAMLYSVSFSIIKSPYNARSDWLRQLALSENRARIDEINAGFQILTNLTQIN